MTDDVEKVTPEVLIANLQQHFGEWVIRQCYHRGESGLLVQVETGQVFVVAVSEVKGVIVT